jgi:hypothetical protein
MVTWRAITSTQRPAFVSGSEQRNLLTHACRDEATSGTEDGRGLIHFGTLASSSAVAFVASSRDLVWDILLRRVSTGRRLIRRGSCKRRLSRCCVVQRSQRWRRQHSACRCSRRRPTSNLLVSARNSRPPKGTCGPGRRNRRDAPGRTATSSRPASRHGPKAIRTITARDPDRRSTASHGFTIVRQATFKDAHGRDKPGHDEVELRPLSHSAGFFGDHSLTGEVFS